jgi:hypothetical protein
MLALFQNGGGKSADPSVNIMNMLQGHQSNSLDRQQKRELMNEIKDEMKVMITQISDY